MQWPNMNLPSPWKGQATVSHRYQPMQNPKAFKSALTRQRAHIRRLHLHVRISDVSRPGLPEGNFVKCLVRFTLPRVRYRMWKHACMMVDCVCPQINEFVYINKSIDLSAFTYFSQVRYLNEETAYIAPANGMALHLNLSTSSTVDTCTISLTGRYCSNVARTFTCLVLSGSLLPCKGSYNKVSMLCPGGPRVFLNLEDHNSFNAPTGPVINTDFHVRLWILNPGLHRRAPVTFDATHTFIPLSLCRNL